MLLIRYVLILTPSSISLWIYHSRSMVPMILDMSQARVRSRVKQVNSPAEGCTAYKSNHQQFLCKSRGDGRIPINNLDKLFQMLCVSRTSMEEEQYENWFLHFNFRFSIQVRLVFRAGRVYTNRKPTNVVGFFVVGCHGCSWVIDKI